MKPLPTIALNLCWLILIRFASAIRSIAIYPTLCLVPLYWSVGLPNPTITFILCSFRDFISSEVSFVLFSSWFCNFNCFCLFISFSFFDFNLSIPDIKLLFFLFFCLVTFAVCCFNFSCILAFCCCLFLCFLRSDSQEFTASSASCVAHFSGSFPFWLLPETLSKIFWLMLSGFFFLRCFGRYWFHSS